MNSFIQAVEPTGQRRQFYFDMNTGKTLIIDESKGKVERKNVDKAGGYVRNFHIGVTGISNFNHRLLHFKDTNDKSVTAFENTEVLRQQVPNPMK